MGVGIGSGVTMGVSVTFLALRLRRDFLGVFSSVMAFFKFNGGARRPPVTSALFSHYTLGVIPGLGLFDFVLDHLKLLHVIVGGIISDTAISGSRHCTKAMGFLGPVPSVVCVLCIKAGNTKCSKQATKDFRLVSV